MGPCFTPLRRGGRHEVVCRPLAALHRSRKRSARDSPYFEDFDLPDLLRATASRTSALNADSSTSSPSWMSIARRTFPSRLELKRRAGSFRDAPFAKVSFTTFLYDSPVQMMPSCDQTGVPGFVGLTHFHSSTTSESACLISVRILLRVFPRQSPSSATLFEMSSDADCAWLSPDFFMRSSRCATWGHTAAQTN